jgi:hypothetical protein
MVLESITLAKRDRKMADCAQRLAELDIKKQRLDMEAKMKQLEVEERLAKARYEREREKDKHDLEMLRMRLQYQGVPGISGQVPNAGQFNAEPFPDTSAFGDLGMGLDGNYLM